MSHVACLIPARGGSKGLPGKNIRLLSGKPLIHHTLEAALGCPLITSIHVSTDDAEIAAVALQLPNVHVIDRPAALATDQASSQDVIRHFLETCKKQEGQWPETLVLLQPTSPLRTTQHLIEAIQLFKTLPADAALVSVCPAKPLSWQGALTSDGEIIFHTARHTDENRQCLPGNYRLNGAIYIANASVVYETGFSAAPIYGYVMPESDSVDIDTLEDFEYAEFQMQRRQNQSSRETENLFASGASLS